MLVPPEIARDGDSKILGITDDLKSVAVKGIGVVYRVRFGLLAHLGDLALLRVELHLPGVLPVSKSVEVILELSGIRDSPYGHICYGVVSK